MDSMTDFELDSDKPMTDTRITRVARGAGVPVAAVNALLEEHKRFKTMIQKMSKNKMGGPNDLKEMQRNPALMMKKLQNSMDPQMMQQLGGAGNLMDMMKNMGGMEQMQKMMGSMGGMGGGGMPNMAQMQKMMGRRR